MQINSSVDISPRAIKNPLIWRQVTHCSVYSVKRRTCVSELIRETLCTLHCLINIAYWGTYFYNSQKIEAINLTVTHQTVYLKLTYKGIKLHTYCYLPKS